MAEASAGAPASEEETERGDPPKVDDDKNKAAAGPTLSTSTSSFEALDPHDPQLNHLASLMFSKTAEWIGAELETTAEDYKLLEQMNKVTATKYSDMEQIASNISNGMAQLNVKYAQLQPYLDQIDEIHESVGRLEEAAFKLDSYSKRLEEKFKSLERRY